MSLIARVNFKDGKIVDDFGNNWVYHDTNSSNTTAVSGPFDNTSGFHIEPYHFPICSKLNNAKDSKFCSIDFWVKINTLSQFNAIVLYSIGPQDSGNGIGFTFLDGYLKADNGIQSNNIAPMKTDAILNNKWVHIRMCIDAHNAIGKAEINGEKTVIPGMSSLSSNIFNFSSYANYIGTWTFPPRYGSNTADCDYYDFKLYDSDIIGWNYDSKGACVIY